jgi:antitoxin (DNA-binding transcriptional repressor) of toxin-antitoxin stability system
MTAYISTSLIRGDGGSLRKAVSQRVLRFRFLSGHTQPTWKNSSPPNLSIVARDFASEQAFVRQSCDDARIVYAAVHKGFMQTVRIGIREFRENLSTYLLKSETPVTITRHGDIVGRYYPFPRKPTETQLSAFDEATARVQAELDADDISEQQVNEMIDNVMAEDKRSRNRESL